MIPLSSQSVFRRTPFVTLFLIGACVWVFAVAQPSVDQQSAGRKGTVQQDLRFSISRAAIPCEITRGRGLSVTEYHAVFEAQTTRSCAARGSADASSELENPGKHIYLALVYTMFLHGGVLHLAGNMLMLWVFGRNVENRMGRLPYLAFYAVSGLVSSAGYVVSQASSALPIVGASGAIAGVMGAYLVLYPTHRIRTWLIFGVYPLPACLVLTAWFIGQFYVDPSSGIAYMAHIVGFVLGASVGVWLRADVVRNRPGASLEQGGRPSDLPSRAAQTSERL